MNPRKLLQSPYYLPYNPDLVPLARQMRKNMTRAECRLWFGYLQHLPYPVYKQKPIDKYIVDFYCPKYRLVIEVDGDSHFLDDSALTNDLARTSVLESLGLKVIRFNNVDVLNHLEDVIHEIDLTIHDLTPSE